MAASAGSIIVNIWFCEKKLEQVKYPSNQILTIIFYWLSNTANKCGHEQNYSFIFLICWADHLRKLWKSTSTLT